VPISTATGLIQYSLSSEAPIGDTGDGPGSHPRVDRYSDRDGPTLGTNRRYVVATGSSAPLHVRSPSALPAKYRWLSMVADAWWTTLNPESRASSSISSGV
jgi:hypothetical protein